MQGANLSSSISTNIFSSTSNGTALKIKINGYNSSVNRSARITLTISLLSVGIAGFVGNILVLRFLKTKKKTNSFLRTCSFEKNFTFYIGSLATSDVLSSLISVPAICAELNFDLFDTGWRCKLVKYLIFLFPSITINNLLVINIEKYFSTRKTPRIFKHSIVKKMVMLAWFVGSVNAFLPTLTFTGLRFDLNETHYTVVCRYDNHYLPFRIIYLCYTAIQYVIPVIIIVRINISLFITVWRITRRRKVIDVQRDNYIKMKLRASTFRSTCNIAALTFAFIIPYVFYFAQGIYSHVAKATTGFETDFIVRVTSALIAMANPVVNVLLYLLQMRDFRTFLKKKLKTWFSFQKNETVGLPNVEIQLVSFSTLTLSTMN